MVGNSVSHLPDTMQNDGQPRRCFFQLAPLTRQMPVHCGLFFTGLVYILFAEFFCFVVQRESCWPGLIARCICFQFKQISNQFTIGSLSR